MAETWLSVSQYARVYSVSRTTVYKLIDAGQLVTCRVLSSLRVLNQPPHHQTHESPETLSSKISQT